jgi:integrase
MTHSLAAAAETAQEPEPCWATWLGEQIDPAWRPGEWDSDRWLFTGHPDNSATGVSRCMTRACSTFVPGQAGLCVSCRREHAVSGMSVEVFANTHVPVRVNRSPGTEFQERTKTGAPCRVPSCDLAVYRSNGLCFYHYSKRLRDCPNADVTQWAQRQRPFLHAQHFSLAPLQPLVRLEMLYALQQRDLEGLILYPALVRRLVKQLETKPSARLMVNVTDDKQLKSSKHFHSFARGVHHVLMGGYNQMQGIEVVADPPVARAYDGEGVSQPWLQMLITDWERRTEPAPDRLREAIRAAHVASQALEKRRHGGHDYTSLAFDDMDAIVKAMRNLTYPDGPPYSYSYRRALNGRFFELIEFGRKAGLLDDVPGSFARHRSHFIPCPAVDDDEPGRALPELVIAQLDAQLATIGDTFQYRGWNRDHIKLMLRTAYIVLRDTGRRPQEICKLKLDCLFESDGYVSIWDNWKAKRLRRQLPILTQTAEAINHWRDERATMPITGASANYLFPGRRQLSRTGQESLHLTSNDLSNALLRWVRSLDNLNSDVAGLDGKPLPFDRSRIFPYAFRHSYAQRLADAGVAVDVLKDLMDHKSIDTTMGYYKVTLNRKRHAVETMRSLVIDHTGKSAAATSATTYELRSVAVPYGNCIEPSNVKAGGQACPIRFQCAGCGFYRPDPSYLLAIDEHILSLKATREKALAVAADDFVVRNLNDQINAFDRVRTKMREQLREMDAKERQEIEEASTVLRKSRASQGLPTTLTITPIERPGND